MIGHAIFSECGQYRYSLSRIWDTSKNTILYIMLNPSTADAEIFDPTVKRCWLRASGLDYGQMLVGNIFALRSTNPKGLYAVDDPVGPRNDAMLLSMAAVSHTIVLGWGDYGRYRNRGAEVVNMLRTELANYKHRDKLWCLKVNAHTRMPKHPLYCAYELPLIEYTEQWK